MGLFNHIMHQYNKSKGETNNLEEEPNIIIENAVESYQDRQAKRLGFIVGISDTLYFAEAIFNPVSRFHITIYIEYTGTTDHWNAWAERWIEGNTSRNRDLANHVPLPIALQAAYKYASYFKNN